MDISASFAQVSTARRAALPLRYNWHRFAAFVVPKAPDLPPILFEAGYTTNAEDAAYLSAPDDQREIAEGLRRAIEGHFARWSVGMDPLMGFLKRSDPK